MENISNRTKSEKLDKPLSRVRISFQDSVPDNIQQIQSVLTTDINELNNVIEQNKSEAEVHLVVEQSPNCIDLKSIRECVMKQTSVCISGIWVRRFFYDELEESTDAEKITQ